MKWLFSFLFIVRVSIPFGLKVTYDDVKDVVATHANTFQLILSNDKIVLVPIMWTVIEEK